MPIRSSLGVQSWCFRRFPDSASLLPKLAQLGLTRIEFCGVQIPFEKPEDFPRLLAPYRQAGISVDAVGVVTVKPGGREAENAFRLAKEAGARVVNVSFAIEGYLDSLRTVEALARKFGVKAAIHNHGGKDWLGNRGALESVLAVAGPEVGLCLDTAWALDAGEDPLEMIGRLCRRLYGIHLKDFVFDRNGKPRDVVIGSGNLDLAGVLNRLDEMDFDGSLTLEYEGDAEDPVPALRDCVDAFRSRMPGGRIPA